MRQELFCYACGDGALNFTWQIKEDGRHVASGRQVKRPEVERYFASDDAKHLRARGYKILNINGQWRLVRIPKRIDETRLRFKGDKYSIEYSVDASKIFADGEISDQAITGTCTKDKQTEGDPFNTFALKNINDRAALRFYLNNRSVIYNVLNNIR